jgi:hypothetical protein
MMSWHKVDRAAAGGGFAALNLLICVNISGASSTCTSTNLGVHPDIGVDVALVSPAGTSK